MRLEEGEALAAYSIDYQTHLLFYSWLIDNTEFALNFVPQYLPERFVRKIFYYLVFPRHANTSRTTVPKTI